MQDEDTHVHTHTYAHVHTHTRTGTRMPSYEATTTQELYTSTLENLLSVVVERTYTHMDTTLSGV